MAAPPPPPPPPPPVHTHHHTTSYYPYPVHTAPPIQQYVNQTTTAYGYGYGPATVGGGVVHSIGGVPVVLPIENVPRF